MVLVLVDCNNCLLSILFFKEKLFSLQGTDSINVINMKCKLLYAILFISNAYFSAFFSLPIQNKYPNSLV